MAMTDEGPIKKQTNRRDFLLGRSALNALHDATGSLIPDSESAGNSIKDDSLHRAKRRQASYWEQYSKNAMGCEFEILLNLGQYPQAPAVVGEAFQLIDDLESQLTVYRTTSEISQINELAFDEEVEVEAGLFDLLEESLRLYHETEGAFDVTAGQLTTLWGFDRRSATLPRESDLAETLVRVGSESLKLDRVERRIRFLKQGLKINLGAIGKGYAIDKAAELMLRCGIQDFAIHGGQSSVKAFGVEDAVDNSNDSDRPTGWWIGLSHPLLPQTSLGRVRLDGKALGTSGSGRQGFFHQGKRYGHIIDPRTGWPASSVLSSTVITDSAAQADALATAFFVMGVESVARYCEDHEEVSAILISRPPEKEKDGPVMLLQTFNFSPEHLELNLEEPGRKDS